MGASMSRKPRAVLALRPWLMWWGLGRLWRAPCHLDADDLLDAARADRRLGVDADPLLSPEAGDVLVEAGARLGRDIDPVLLAGEDRAGRPVDQEARASLCGRPVRVGEERDAPRR